jgi:hypothetical protein
VRGRIVPEHRNDARGCKSITNVTARRRNGTRAVFSMRDERAAY